MSDCRKIGAASMAVAGAFLLTLVLVSPVHSGDPAPYTEKAVAQVEAATRAYFKKNTKPPVRKGASPAEGFRENFNMLRRVYSDAGYDLDATIVQMADDLKNHQDRIPLGRVTIFNHLVAMLHLMKSECEYNKVNCLDGMPVPTIEAVRFIWENTNFNM